MRKAGYAGIAAVFLLLAATDVDAWVALANDPQVIRALGLSLWSGLASTFIALVLCKRILGYAFTAKHSTWTRLLRWLPPMLAVPHAAFAIGLLALLAPGGWILRLLSPWATGLTSPPPWVTTQDPWCLGLIATLVFKEAPFLLWVSAMHLQQSDMLLRLRKEVTLALTMGYSKREAWQRVVWPQLNGHMYWPVLAVLAYGLSVVDVALVIGPTSPPTLGLLSWQWLQDADITTNAKGVVAAWLLAALIALSAFAGKLLLNGRYWKKHWTEGPRAVADVRDTAAPIYGAALLFIYVAVLSALAAGSVVGVWPFPDVLPQSWTGAAWQSVWESRTVVMGTFFLALCSASAALVGAVVWLEWAPQPWQSNATRLIYLPLALPAVMWVLGLHRLTIALESDATWHGLWLSHTLVCVPYVLLAVQTPYRQFNPKLQAVASSLGHSRMAFLRQVKWPLLKATLASAVAVGFAVSVAQYLPTLYVGGGRFSTVSTEAVNLAAGGQRSLASAYAWLQWVLPLLVFAVANVLGRPRRFT